MSIDPNRDSAQAAALTDENVEELYEQAPCGYLSTAPDGRIVRVNQTLLSWLGYAREELVAASRFPALLTTAGRIYYDTHISLLLRMHGAAHEIALDLVAKDGRRVPALISAVQKRTAEGTPVLNRFTLFDASERRHYEQELVQARRRAEQLAASLTKANDELRRANADLQQFAYSASHDLKQPLRTMRVYAQLLHRKYRSELRPEAQEYLDYVAHGAKRMHEFLEDLLAYVQAGHVADEEVEPASAEQALDEAVELLGGAIREAGAHIEKQSLPAVRATKVHLRQLFQNLIGNALKYHGDEPPAIKVSAGREGGRWTFVVEDNGIGIEPAYVDQIFGLFKRLHDSTTYSGTGIGLAICRKIVERYGGRIWAESAGLGRGSRFLFTLPDAADTEPEDARARNIA